jgi:hypothetical protein
MNALLKLKPGLFGLMAIGIAVGSFASSIGDVGQLAPAPNQRTDIQSAAVGQIQPETPPSEQTQPEAEAPYTYYQYAVDTDLLNLEQAIGNRALELLDAELGSEALNARLWDISQEWQGTPNQLVERIAIHRALQTLVDGEPRPTGGAISNPTVEGYKNAK